MSLKVLVLVLATYFMFCKGVYIYSSFWAPLFDPRILNYRVNAIFDPETGKNARDDYEKKFGYRGERLVADLGNRIPPSSSKDVSKEYGDVKFYYTYNGADGRGSF